MFEGSYLFQSIISFRLVFGGCITCCYEKNGYGNYPPTGCLAKEPTLSRCQWWCPEANSHVPQLIWLVVSTHLEAIGIHPHGSYIIVYSWWLNQPIWNICSSNWSHLPQIGNIKMFETTTQFCSYPKTRLNWGPNKCNSLETLGWDKFDKFVSFLQPKYAQFLMWLPLPCFGSSRCSDSLTVPCKLCCEAPYQDQITSMVRVAGNRVAQRRIAQNKANDRNAKEGKLSYACASPFLLYPVLFWYRFGFCSARHIFPENILACVSLQ